MADEEYKNNILKYRRQRDNIREFMEYVDGKRNEIFEKNLTPSGDFN